MPPYLVILLLGCANIGYSYLFATYWYLVVQHDLRFLLLLHAIHTTSDKPKWRFHLHSKYCVARASSANTKMQHLTAELVKNGNIVRQRTRTCIFFGVRNREASIVPQRAALDILFLHAFFLFSLFLILHHSTGHSQR
jgi:hypothetical protein